MLSIRFRRVGKKKKPEYRLIVSENRKPLQGAYIEAVGHYNPMTKKTVLKKERILEWLKKGAQPSNTVSKLLKKEGMEHGSIKIHTFKERPPKKEAKPKEPARTVTPSVAGGAAPAPVDAVQAVESAPVTEEATAQTPVAETTSTEAPAEATEAAPEAEGAAPAPVGAGQAAEESRNQTVK